MVKSKGRTRALFGKAKLYCVLKIPSFVSFIKPPRFYNIISKLLNILCDLGDRLLSVYSQIGTMLAQVRTEAGRKSFLFQESKLCNKLPDALKQEQSIMNFKRQCDQLDSEFDFQICILWMFLNLIL